MKNKIGDAARINHIMDAVLEIEKYLYQKTYNDFLNDTMLQSACIRQLEIIGEAAGRISEALKEKSDSVKWREIIGLRNLLIHEYFGVDIDLVWQIIETDLPKLKSNILLVIEEND